MDTTPPFNIVQGVNIVSEETIQLVITSVIAPTVLYLAKVVSDSFLKKGGTEGVETEEIPNKELNTPNLGDHIFFEKMSYLDRHIQFFFTIPNKGKEKVFKDIISVLIRTYINQMEILVREDLNDMSDIQLYHLVLKYLDTSITESSSFYHNTEYTIDEQQVLEIVMSKFNRWHRSRIDQVYRSAEMVCNSKFYGSPTVKVSVFLDLLLGSFIDTVNDAESTLNELNGDLKGLVYKNIQL